MERMQEERWAGSRWPDYLTWSFWTDRLATHGDCVLRARVSDPATTHHVRRSTTLPSPPLPCPLKLIAASESLLSTL